MTGAEWGAITSMVIGAIVTPLINQALTERKDKVRRQVEKEERETAAQAIKDELARTAKELASQTASQVGAVKSAVAENTALTRTGIAKAEKAFNEANNVNEKLVQLGRAPLPDDKGT